MSAIPTHRGMATDAIFIRFGGSLTACPIESLADSGSLRGNPRIEARAALPPDLGWAGMRSSRLSPIMIFAADFVG